MNTQTRTGLSLLRVLTCGSVDDGKSTLLGRLLYDAGLVPDDHLAAVVRDSNGRPCGLEGIDFSLLVDGLQAEREQGITIDVAHRYFETPARKYILADTPGHEQYTRNMATAASRADAALLLVDVRKGLVAQTCRHMTILSLFGVTQVAAAANKMDLVDFDEARYSALTSAFAELGEKLRIPNVVCIPVDSIGGQNVVARATAMPWYQGPTVLEWLETAQPHETSVDRPFRMAIQRVSRLRDFRGLSGTVSSGRIRTGDTVVIQPSRHSARLGRIVTMEGDHDSASAGDAVTLVLDEDVDAGRGDLLTAADEKPAIVDQFAAHLVWFGDEQMIPGRSYMMRLGTAQPNVTVTKLKHRIDVLTQEHLAANTLRANDIGFCNLATDRLLPVEAFGASDDTGVFILIDRASKATVAAGLVAFPLQRAANVPWQSFDTVRSARAHLMGHEPAIVWLTGLSGAGKSTVANLLERQLVASGRHVYVLDGDNMRHGLNKDLGFTVADRVENIRRTAEVARLMADAGLIVVVSLISPFRSERAMAREIAGDIEFLEVYVDAPLPTCEARDPKGLYRKARSGMIKNFTGIDSPYEPPESADLHLRTDLDPPEVLVHRILDALET
jgi:bifunctional enzyme CysN/CysC